MEKMIIHPTDFSDCADNALDYAILIAKNLGLKISIVHSLDLDTTPDYGEGAQEMMESSKNEEKEAEAKLQEIGAKIQSHGVACSASIYTGRINTWLPNLMKKSGAMYTIMGTTGASSLKNKIMGSNTYAIIKESNQPLIAVPSEAKTSNFSKFVYLSDIKKSDVSALKNMANLASKTNASIQVIHFSDAEKEEAKLKDQKKFNEFEQTVKNEVENIDLSFQIQHTDDIEDGIKKYADELNPDLLALAMRKQNFIQRFFKGSLTESLVNHSDTPLLIFPQ